MVEKIAIKQEPQSQPDEEVRRAYFLRIEELKGYAVEDEIKFNPASERDFWEFVESQPANRRASLVLSNAGNLKAVWKDADANHLSIQFLGNSQGEYIIFKRRENASKISRVVGIDSLEGILVQIASFDIVGLVSG